MKTFTAVGLIAITVVMAVGFGCVSTTATLPMIDISTTPRPTPDIEAEGSCPSRPDPNDLSYSEWVVVEMLPEMIYFVAPQYPRLAEQA